MNEDLTRLKKTMTEAFALTEEAPNGWKFDQGWSTDKLCPNCKTQVQASQVAGGGGKSTIICTGCGKKGLTKIESGTQLINWKLDPH